MLLSSVWRVSLLASFFLMRVATAVAADRETHSAPVRYSIRDEIALPMVGAHDASPVGINGSTAHPFCRAGHPECIHRLAVPSNDRRYTGYYVGGGLPVRGNDRCVLHEGTWGWDYCGILLPKRIALKWGHGLRHQGGAGAYKTDGPKLRHQ